VEANDAQASRKWPLASCFSPSARLFARTLRNFSRVDVGFDTDNLLVFKPAAQKASDTFDLYDRLVAAIDAVPGVKGTTHSAMP
jgi:hypothetical protein